MRIKQIWDVAPLPSKLRLAYSLVTLNLPTTVFFVLSLLQCLFQSGLHGWSVSHHQSFTLQIKEVALNTSIITQPLAILSGDQFFLCDAIPAFAGGLGKCIRAVFQPQDQSSNEPTTLGANSTLAQILANNTQQGPLSSALRQCAEVSPWVFQELRAATLEDKLFLASQFWRFCISLSAILFQSIPHLMAALASEGLASIATAFRIAGTPRFEATFERLVTKGACHGIELLPGYFPPRRTAEIVICVLNCTMFVILAGLSYRLIQIYGRNSFEKVQGKPEMSRLYIVLLSLSSSVHLAAFFIVAGLGFVTDQLLLGPLRELALDKTKSIAIQAVIYVLVPPWMFLGWTCGRVESKSRIAAFIAITAVFLVLWAGSFTCSTNRFVFLTWDFYAALAIAPGCFMVFILFLAIYIWLHLDLGLAAYLKHAEPPHPADQVRWSFAARQDTETGNSPSSEAEDGYMKSSVIWYRPPSPSFPRAVDIRLPSPSDHSISTESSKPSDIIVPIESLSSRLDSATSPEVTTLRRTPPRILAPFPVARHGRTNLYQVILRRGVVTPQGAPLRQPLMREASGLVAQVERTAPVDITDSWMRRHIATSVIFSAPPTPTESPRGASVPLA